VESVPEFSWFTTALKIVSIFNHCSGCIELSATSVTDLSLHTRYCAEPGRAAKTIRVSNVGTEALPQILTALRIILNLRHADVGPSAVVIEDTMATIAFAEKIVADLDRPARR
jgi:hypothetical protein